MTAPAPSGPAEAPAALPLRESIAARLLRIIFGAYLIVALLVTAVQLALEYRNTEARVVAELEAMQNTFGHAISDAMWNYNTEVLGGIMSASFHAPVRPWAVAAAMLVSGLVGLVAGLYPANRAAMLDPVVALRAD